MALSDLLLLAERFQTGIVGIVGFCGVILTLRVNARHAAKDHRRGLDARRNALRKLLLAEFRNYAHAMKLNLETAYPQDEPISVGRVRRLLSEDLSHDLGLLELGEIDAVVNALISFKGLDHYFASIASEQTDTRFLIVPANIEKLRYACETTKKALDLAIETLEAFDEV